MKLTPPFFIALICALAIPPESHAFGSEGHETVGAIADESIRGTKAEKRVRQVLGKDSLSHAANWADRAKSPTTSEMKAFVRANPQHKSYHYTDVPIQEASYKNESAGTSTNDIVHIMRQCIDVLQGKATPTSNPHHFSQKVALLLLAHHVGDIHQPLHVGAAYLNDSLKFVNPNNAAGKVYDDQGGNFLTIRGHNLHELWDTQAVRNAMKNAHVLSPSAFAHILILTGPEPAKISGPAAGWPKLWANEELPLAAKAHANLKVGPRKVVHEHETTHDAWEITLPDSYGEDAAKVVTDRLRVGGFRLAQLLREIWPE